MAEEITFEGFVKKLTTALNDCGIDYLLIGGVASVVYGRPRTTSDCDIIISIEEKDLKGFAQCLSKNSFRIQEYDVLEGFREKSHFNAYLGDSPYRADFSWRSGSLAEHGFERARKIKLFGIVVPIEAPEDVIIAKLVYGSPQDLEDAKSILHAQKELNNKYIERRAQEEGVNDKLESLYKELGKK